MAEFVAKNASFAQMVANIIGTEHSAILRTAQVTFNVFTNFEKCFYVTSGIIDYYLFFCQVECPFFFKKVYTIDYTLHPLFIIQFLDTLTKN